MNDLFSLKQKVAIVTGGNGGIGKGITRAFASMGADVAIVGRKSQKTEAAASEIREEFGVRALGLICDVTDEKAVQQMTEEVRRELMKVLANVGVPFDLQLYTYRRAYDGVQGWGSKGGNEKLLGAIESAHKAMFGQEPERCLPQHTSMWRDINVFHEAGIPGAMYGPGISLFGGLSAIKASELIRAARLYTRIALECCALEN